MLVVGPGHCAHDTRPVDHVLAHSYGGSEAEPWRENAHANDGVVPQSGPDRCRLSRAGASASLARPVFGQLCSCAGVGLISVCNLRAVAH
jgi:hypothetical protein